MEYYNKEYISKLTGTKTIKITPELAEKWLLLNNSNRNPSRRHVSRLADTMQRGEWMLNGQCLIFGSNGELLDGQHRLLAIVKSGMTIEMDVRFGVNPCGMPTIDEGKKRIAGDVFKMNGILNYNTAAAASKFVYRYDNFRFGGSGAADQNMTNAAALKWFYSNPSMADATKKGTSFYAASCKMVLSKSKFAAYYFIMSRINQQLAEHFCSGLASGANLSIGSPIYKLRSELLKAAMDKQRRLTATAEYDLISWAWNNFRLGKSPKAIRIPKNDDGTSKKLE